MQQRVPAPRFIVLSLFRLRMFLGRKELTSSVRSPSRHHDANVPVVTAPEVIIQDSFDLRLATPGGSISGFNSR